MSTLRNKVQLIGRLGTDPEVRTFDSGKMMARFSLATNDVYYNSQGEKVEDTQWHNIVAWGKRVKAIEKHLKKGSEVTVEGKIVSRSYEKEGEKKYVTEISINDIIFMDNRNQVS